MDLIYDESNILDFTSKGVNKNIRSSAALKFVLGSRLNDELQSDGHFNKRFERWNG